MAPKPDAVNPVTPKQEDQKLEVKKEGSSPNAEWLQMVAAKQEKEASAAPTKMVVATEIYKRMIGVKGVTRKDIIQRFIEEVKLTKAGASTYYQLIKAKEEFPPKK
ncbi:hypothetical protein [Cupriavidus oxalaticus]|uniref:hypothetical protein n=1 Tax=Cupriavidus oxalaticus TaxID=96344 RepID=UPI0035258E35